MALYLILWALDNLTYVPIYAFSVSHYGSLAAPGVQNYLYMHYLLLLLRHLGLTIALLLASVWLYRCGPTISRFLSLSEEQTG